MLAFAHSHARSSHALSNATRVRAEASFHALTRGREQARDGSLHLRRTRLFSLALTSAPVTSNARIRSSLPLLRAGPVLPTAGGP
eukprot:1795344-Pleurochrysis_carterae.AAC.1